MLSKVREHYRGLDLVLETYGHTAWVGYYVVRIGDRGYRCMDHPRFPGTHRATEPTNIYHRRPHRTADSAFTCGRAVIDQRRRANDDRSEEEDDE